MQRRNPRRSRTPPPRLRPLSQQSKRWCPTRSCFDRAEVEQQKNHSHQAPIASRTGAATRSKNSSSSRANDRLQHFCERTDANGRAGVATQIARSTASFRDGAPRERRGVHKVEQVVVAPPPALIEKKEELKRTPRFYIHGARRHGRRHHGCDSQDRVAAGEAGGIIQHIALTRRLQRLAHHFLDTPAHAALPAERAARSKVTTSGPRCRG